MPTVSERFWMKVERGDGCWPWRAATMPNGYGRFKPQHDSPSFLAHRYAYELERGPIPSGLTIDHLCRNRACVNPAHLEAVTMRTNILRGTGHAARNARRTRCPRGHSYTVVDRVDRHRICRTCRALNERRRRTHNG